MACYYPIPAYRMFDGSVSFKKRGDIVSDLQLPCGQCIGCRLERSRQWAVRCMHEASLHEQNCFITLTYDDEFLPVDGGLRVRDFQLFMKRLRKHFFSQRVRFFHCGEYGDLNRRPHYHAILFGVDFDDKIAANDCLSPLYISPVLRQLWPYGMSTVGAVSFESAAYVARYSLKKITGPNAELHYQRVIPETGEIVQISPEYVTMSRRPGIGRGWIDKFHSDVYPSDEVIINGHSSRPPRFYDNFLDVHNGLLLDDIKFKREQNAALFSADSEPDRLAVRAEVVRAKSRLKSRSV